jgi:hypothetical protein
MTTGDSHHQRKQHVRHKNGSITPVRETLVRNRGATSGAPRNKTNHDALLNLAAPNSDDSDDDLLADRVIFAFEHPEWSSRGFDRKTSRPWMEHGVAPESAAEWRDAGFDAEFAASWRLRSSRDGKLAPVDDAIKFIENDIDAVHASSWITSEFTIEESIAWIKKGSHPHDANVWKSMGVSHPDDTQPYEEIGLSDPTEVRLISQMGRQRAHDWLAEGVSLREALSYEFLVDDENYPVKRVAGALANPDTGNPDNKIAWVRSEVPLDQISTFVEKGYSPRRAATQHKKGRTSATAADLRDGEPVPGKAWKELKAAFAEKAKKANCDVTISTKETYGPRKIVTVTLTDKTDPTTTNTYDLFFSSTGTFEQGRSNIKRKTRLLSSRAAYMRLHFPE